MPCRILADDFSLKLSDGSFSLLSFSVSYEFMHESDNGKEGQHLLVVQGRSNEVSRLFTTAFQ